MFYVLLLLLCHFTFSSEAQSQEREPIVIRAEKLRLPFDSSFETTATLTSDEIEEKSYTSDISEVLQGLPSLQVRRNGGAGQTISVFLRGAQAHHLLVVIDGVPAQDSLAPSGGPLWQTLTPEMIERIEVITGPSTVFYGADALGGVLAITTRKGTKAQKKNGTFSFAGGNFESYQTAFNYAKQSKTSHYALGLSAQTTSGPSAAKSYQAEKDGSEKISFQLSSSKQVNKHSSLQFSSRYTQQKQDLDRSGGPNGDDPNYTGENKQLILSLGQESLLLSGLLKSNLNFGLNHIERSNKNLPDPTNNTELRAHFKSDLFSVRWKNTLLLSSQHSLFFSPEWQREKGDSFQNSDGTIDSFDQKSQRLNSLSIGHHYQSPTAFFSVKTGGRYDHHTQGEEFNYSLRPTWFFFSKKGEINLKLSSGVKFPTLYQLYSNYGNLSLKEEKAQGQELNLWYRESSTTAHLSFFHTRYTNLIDFDFASSKYINQGKARTYGGEIHLAHSLSSWLNIATNYSYLRSEDLQTGKRLLRRATHNGKIELQLIPSSRFKTTLIGEYLGERDDIDPTTFSRIVLPRVTLAHWHMVYNFNPTTHLKAKLDNLFNNDYEEVAGYETGGRTFWLGLSKDF